MTRPCWEYETARGPLERGQLNALGAKGWELVAADGLNFIFKRAVETGAPEDDPAERVRRDRAELQAIRGS